jgi:hypothetical protein
MVPGIPKPGTKPSDNMGLETPIQRLALTGLGK